MVGPVLDELLGIEAWHVRTESPNKLLTIRSNSLQVSELQDAFSELGFEAKPVA